MRVCFETFGCRLNKAEALQMEADYLSRGWEATDEHGEADLFVVRGCSVTARAQHECERMISHLRRHYPSVPIRVCGCINDKSAKTPAEARAALREAARTVSGDRDPVPMRTSRAYLKVQDGCSGACTFCIVPQFRGKSVSVPYTDVMDKARRFVDAGYGEIVVTGCNLSLYASEGRRLPELLAGLAALGGARIRLGSLEPGSCAMETIHVIAEHDSICRFLHVSAQSGSNRILQAMRRPYNVRDVDSLVSTASKLVSDMGIGCDLMTGFPGESDLDFQATKGLLKRLPFTSAHVFPYSERPGTLAAGFSCPVNAGVRSARAHRLASLAEAKRETFAKKFIGRTVEIAVEDDRRCSGWTSEYLRCNAVGTAPRRSLASIFVTRVNGDASLEGRLAAKPRKPAGGADRGLPQQRPESGPCPGKENAYHASI